jgi:peptidoglycan-N-acetylglucosamine deacetylase
MSWRPTPFVALTLALHFAAPVICLLRPALWVWALLALLANHLVITAVGLWPRSTALGPNLTRLPEAAARRGEVAITIDDGPDPEVTPQVLAILAAQQSAVNTSEHAPNPAPIPAPTSAPTPIPRVTFFCIGERAQNHADLCRAIVDAGHHVENHGMRHRWPTAFFGPRGWHAEVAEGRAAIAAITSRAPRFFRPIAGLRNPFLDPILHRMGQHLVSWTRRGFDSRESDPDIVLARLLDGLAAGDILLLHDGGAARMSDGRAVILAVLPRLLLELHARGLRSVTLEHACTPR